MSPVTRTLPAYLAPIVEELELDQAELVTMAHLRHIIQRRSLKTGAARIAAELRGRGWLLSTGAQGVWEFAPGAHAGPYGHGQPFRAVQAAMLAYPEIQMSVCLNSALWARGLLDSTPDRPEVAMKPGVRVPEPLRRSCRVMKFEARLLTDKLHGVLVHAPATILVHLAARPTDVRSWGLVIEALPDLVAEVLEVGGQELLEVELETRPGTARTRLAYLIEGVAPSLARDLTPRDHGVVWFGRRTEPTKRFHPSLQVVDTILPMAPSQLPPVERSL